MGQMQPKVTSVGEVKKIVDGLCGHSNKGGKTAPKSYEGNDSKPAMPDAPTVNK